jgi:ferric-dicitrate binding protein FerR (iron transport regulator)
MNKFKLELNESAELSEAFNKPAESERLENFYKEIWNNSHGAGRIKGSERILKSIYLRLGIKNNKFGKLSQTAYKISKYAAIVIVMFFAGWMANGLINSNEKGSLISEGLTTEISVEYGSKSQIILPDGTKVKLNSGSRISYPPVFSDGIRQVNIEGEAYFDVAEDSNKPFIVNASAISIKVLGTSFNVKSYAEENIIETTLVEGSIEIYTNLTKNTIETGKAPIAVLKPNEKATYIKDLSQLNISGNLNNQEMAPVRSNKAGIKIEKEIETSLITAWKDNSLRFKGEKFHDIATKFERWYNVKIEIQNSALNEETFTGQFDTETIEHALDAMKLTASFNYTISKNEITIF